MGSQMQPRHSKGPLVWPLMLVLIGGLLLLGNFLLLGDFRLLDLWPLLLVALGVQLLLRGDLSPSTDFRTFGITRGGIESATLEINSGAVDVVMRALPQRNSERLVAGQYTFQARPELQVTDVHAHLRMERDHTPWLSLADWELALSRDLPWQIALSTSLGQVTANLEGVIVQQAFIHTGFGDIHLTLPTEAFEPLDIQSILGTMVIQAPAGVRARITVQSGAFFNLQWDETRYEKVRQDVDVYETRQAADDAPLVELVLRGTFGAAHLS